MPSRTLPPGFEDFSLSFGSHAWLHSSRWDSANCRWYQTQRRRNRLQIDRSPPIFHARHQASARSEGSWVLFETNAEDHSAWASLHVITRSRYQVGLLFYEERPGLDANQAVEALTTLVSALFLIGKLDQVRLIYRGHQPTGLSRLPANLGSQSELYTLPQAAWRPGTSVLQKLAVFDLARMSWQECKSEELQKGHYNLRHIQSRLERHEKSSRVGLGKKRKRGLIARIFRPRIDDSIF